MPGMLNKGILKNHKEQAFPWIPMYPQGIQGALITLRNLDESLETRGILRALTHKTLRDPKESEGTLGTLMNPK